MQSISILQKLVLSVHRQLFITQEGISFLKTSTSNYQDTVRWTTEAETSTDEYPQYTKFAPYSSSSHLRASLVCSLHDRQRTCFIQIWTGPVVPDGPGATRKKVARPFDVHPPKAGALEMGVGLLSMVSWRTDCCRHHHYPCSSVRIRGRLTIPRLWFTGLGLTWFGVVGHFPRQ